MLNKTAGQFLAAQWWVSQADADIVMKINGLSTKIGSLSASNECMKKMAASLASLGEGAGIAVDTANKVVTFAETSHKVLTTFEMAGGVTVLVKTGATLLIKEGIKAAAKELMQNVASGLAAELASYAGILAGLDDEQKQWLKIGVDSYQVFSFMKAARARFDPNGSCFVAGTQVLVGYDEWGRALTKNIEDIREGDYVLSRDQHDGGDDVQQHRVVRTFVKQSNHLRTLTIRDTTGNVETIRTTDEHPLWIVGKGWVNAGDLRRGDRVGEADGSNDAVAVGTIREEHPDGIVVYNFEVEGDHTYFVEDGQGSATTLWAHNTCVGKKFMASAYGKPLEFDNAVETRFFRRSDVDATLVRNRFNSSEQKNWIKRTDAGEDAVAQLRSAGLSDAEIADMRDFGMLPAGWDVHHKQSIELGGDNNDDNLMIIRPQHKAYHVALTNAQNDVLTAVPNEGDVIERAFPMFEGAVIFDR